MKKIISLVISLSILALIYWRIDMDRLMAVFLTCHTGWFLAGLFMFIPIIVITARRLQMLAPEAADVSMAESIRLVLSAGSLNMVLPSKMGDIAKSYFIAEKGRISGALSLSLVIYEKTCDMLSLMLWCVLGLIVYQEKDMGLLGLSILVISGFVFGILMIGSRRFSGRFFFVVRRVSPNALAAKIEKVDNAWTEMCDYLSKDRHLLFSVAGVSVLLWFLHLIQIWFFVFMLNAHIPLLQHLALVPLAIFVGLLPFTFAGVGTRDAALIFFLWEYLEVPAAAALGLLCTLRYLVPAILGLPFLGGYLEKIRIKNMDYDND